MIFESIVGLSLVLNVSLDTQSPLDTDRAAWQQLSARQRQVALLPLVQRATDCVVQQVGADPRYAAGLRPDEINNLIIDSISACSRPIRAMIDAHDRMFGFGSGEAFLLGPYLDVLPSAVIQQVGSR